jgi:hypothetical protein
MVITILLFIAMLALRASWNRGQIATIYRFPLKAFISLSFDYHSCLCSLGHDPLSNAHHTDTVAQSNRISTGQTRRKLKLHKTFAS